MTLLRYLFQLYAFQIFELNNFTKICFIRTIFLIKGNTSKRTDDLYIKLPLLILGAYLKHKGPLMMIGKYLIETKGSTLFFLVWYGLYKDLFSTLVVIMTSYSQVWQIRVGLFPRAICSFNHGLHVHATI